MTSRGGRQEARPLFVVSNDYGELGLAMHFLRGQEFASRAVLALPDRLYSDHRGLLPGATHRYASTPELLELADGHRANVVLLFSGYLLSNNDILSHESLAIFVQRLRERGCVVVTTDPFLGLAPRLTTEHVWFSGLGYFEPTDPPRRPRASRLLRHLERSVVENLSLVSEILGPVIHLYHRAPEGWTSQQRSRSVSFFNRTPVDSVPVPLEKRWLFILGSEDVRLQQQLAPGTAQGPSSEDAEDGERRFASVVSRLLERAAALERRPTLIGPPSLIQALPPGLASNCELLPFCPLPEFSGYMLRSEFVFYWNVFSASILPRLALHLPVFFFDRGHMARLIPPLYDLGLQLHFGGWEPTCLDPNEPLELAALAHTWAAHGLGNQKVLEAWRQASPAPGDLLEQLVNE